MMTTKDKVEAFVRQQNMLQKEDHVVIGLSGGADSVCLLYLLLELAKEYVLKLTAVHIEHGIRGEEALEDAEFVHALCKKVGVVCYVEHYDVPRLAKEAGMTEEEMGRKLRYESFERIATEVGANKIAVAHHENDVAETMLFNLCRGTGLGGLCSLIPVRGNIIRPLLCLSREEIEQYLEKEQLSYCNDSTNEDTDYSRNYIRKEILPRLTMMNPKAVSHMAQTAQMLSGVRNTMEDKQEELKAEYVLTWEESKRIKQELFLKADEYSVTGVLHNVIGEIAGSKKDIQAVHIRQVHDLAAMQVGKKIDLPYNLEAVKIYDGVEIRKKSPKFDFTFCGEEPLKIPGETFFANGTKVVTRLFAKDTMEIPDKKYTKWFDYDTIKGHPVVRCRRTSDYMVIDGAGGRKKIKDLFINEKIPREERDEILLIADEELILWAVGVRMGEYGKVSEDTKTILEITICGGKEHE